MQICLYHKFRFHRCQKLLQKSRFGWKFHRQPQKDDSENCESLKINWTWSLHDVATWKFNVQISFFVDRNQDPVQRKEYVKMHDDVVDAGGDVKIFSSMHVSGERKYWNYWDLIEVLNLFLSRAFAAYRSRRHPPLSNARTRRLRQRRRFWRRLKHSNLLILSLFCCAKIPSLSFCK